MTKRLPYKLVAIDLDETLLGHDKQVSSDNRKALSILRSHGVMPVLASGRRHENMARYHRALDLTGYIVSAQGAIAKHAETDTIVYDASLSAELSDRIIQEGLSTGATVVVYHAKAVFAEGSPASIAEYARLSGDRVEVRPLETLRGERMEKAIWIGAPGQVETWRGRASATFAEVAETVITEPTFLEFTARGVNKASALAALATHLGVAQEEVLAFGDGNNDVGMLAWAGLGVAMGHGKESAKAASDLVTPAGDPGSGFARGVEAVLARHGLASLAQTGC